jgi:hypothetical protein
MAVSAEGPWTVISRRSIAAGSSEIANMNPSSSGVSARPQVVELVAWRLDLDERQARLRQRTVRRALLDMDDAARRDRDTAAMAFR